MIKEKYYGDDLVGGRIDVDNSQNSSEPSVIPEFNFSSANVNLKYNQFLPFVAVYLFYKFIWKKI